MWLLSFSSLLHLALHLLQSIICTGTCYNFLIFSTFCLNLETQIILEIGCLSIKYIFIFFFIFFVVVFVVVVIVLVVLLFFFPPRYDCKYLNDIEIFVSGTL